ncbi:MAG: Na/Pi cotransporter family protein [Clostridium sp.]|nr:Na/Pi cotransporter family protein [Clostridium sp.]
MEVLLLFKFIGCLGLLMYGMKLTSEALQKMAGSQLRHILDALTTNRFTSMLTGALVSGIVLSSTSTSVMSISFIHAGMLSFVQGLSVIMGASVGNTLIAWIMAAEFNFSLSDYIYPLFIPALCLIYSRNHRSQGEALFGMCFIFLWLGALYHTAGEMHLDRMECFGGWCTSEGNQFGFYLICLLVGAALTMLIRSSGALMAASMVFCSVGVLSVYAGVALVMGENIGRAVITARAAVHAGLQARRTALAQFIFNLFGVVWAFGLFPYFVDVMIPLFDYDPQPGAPGHVNLAYVLAAFHTCFNLCNVAIFIGLVKPLERLSERFIPKDAEGEDEDGELRYITCGLLTTPELSVLEAQKEITNYADTVCRMFTTVRYLLNTERSMEFKQLYERVQRYEQVTDEMEVEIVHYLNEVSDDRLSSDTKTQIRSMLREVSEIESIGDSCYHLARTIGRKYQGKAFFTAKQKEHLHQMFQLVEQALEEMKRVIGSRNIPSAAPASFYIEQEINNFRKQLRMLNFMDVNHREYSYQMGTLYMELINECEKLGDYVINVVEARLDARPKDN